MVGKDTWNERSLAAGLLLLGFLLVLPAVFIIAAGLGANSAWGRDLAERLSAKRKVYCLCLPSDAPSISNFL